MVPRGFRNGTGPDRGLERGSGVSWPLLREVLHDYLMLELLHGEMLTIRMTHPEAQHLSFAQHCDVGHATRNRQGRHKLIFENSLPEESPAQPMSTA
jgi:hypothetical protein